MTWFWASLHMFICHLYIFFGEVSVQVFCLYFFCCCFKFIYLFIWGERERDSEHASTSGWEAERRRDRIPSSLHAINAEPLRGLSSQTVRSWAEPWSRVGRFTDSATQMPLLPLFKIGLFVVCCCCCCCWDLCIVLDKKTFGFIRYIFCKYFLPVCALSSHSLDSIFCRVEVFNCNEVPLINSFMNHAFDGASKNHLHSQENLDIVLCYLLRLV